MSKVEPLLATLAQAPMKIDPETLRPHFSLLSGELSLSLRALVYDCTEHEIFLLTDRYLGARPLEDLAFESGKKVVVQKVEPNADFERALAFFANRGGAGDDTVWQLECDPQFRRKCPLNWFDLKPTADPCVRDCSICAKPVHLAQDMTQAQTLAAQGWCTATLQGATPEDESYLIGDVDVSYLSNSSDTDKVWGEPLGDDPFADDPPADDPER